MSEQNAGRPLMALTFDDGPNTVTTPQVLDVLAEYGVPASFFLIADNITPESARVARRAFDMGCDIENHSRTHRHMGTMTAEEIRGEIEYCTRRVTEITGRAPDFFRPPYIDLSQSLFDTVELTCISGVGCLDWKKEVSAQQRVDMILSSARDGNIQLLHDSLGNQNTVEALKVVIPALKARGFGFVTCAELFRQKGVVPRRGCIYANVFSPQGL